MKSLTELYTDVTVRTDLMLSPLQPRIACKSSSKDKLSPACAAAFLAGQPKCWRA